jgi:hypothetical protein
MRLLIILAVGVTACGGSGTSQPETMSWSSWRATTQVGINAIGDVSRQTNNPVRAETILKIINEEQARMRGVRPEPCYRPAFDAYREYLRTLKVGMEHMVSGDLTRAASSVERAATHSDTLTDAIYRANLDCG